MTERFADPPIASWRTGVSNVFVEAKPGIAQQYFSCWMALPAARSVVGFIKNKSVYKLVVVVNSSRFLWISQADTVESTVYGLHNHTRKPCMAEERFLDKNRRSHNRTVYAQTMPVDIHTLIHRHLSTS